MRERDTLSDQLPRVTEREAQDRLPAVDKNDLANAMRGINPETGEHDPMSARVWLKNNGFLPQ